MAVTILQTPQTFTPCYNPMWFTVSGTHTANSGFNYVFYVDIDDWTGSYTNKATIRIPKRPDSVVGVIDVSRIVSDYVNTSLDTTNYGFYYNENLVRYKVRCDEEWTGSAAGSGTTLLTGYAFGGSLRGNDFVDWVDTPYKVTDYLTQSNTKFLTAWSNRNIYTNQNLWLSALVGTTNTADKLVVKTYNSAGTLLGTYKINNGFNNLTTYPKGRMIRVNCGTYGLNQATLSSGSQPIITASVSYYTVGLLDTSGGFDFANSEVKTINIIDANCKYDNYRLHWLNELGGWDSFNFNLVSKKTISVDRQTFTKPLGTLTGGSFGYTKQDRRIIPFSISSQDTIELNSDWISETESALLQELITSPEIYWEQTTSQLIPVTIVDKNYEEKKEVNDRLFNLTLKIQTNEIKERQRY